MPKRIRQNESNTSRKRRKFSKIPKKGQHGKYRGVFWDNKKKKWRAEIRIDNENFFGGGYKAARYAAHAVNILCDRYDVPRKNSSLGDPPLHLKLSNLPPKKLSKKVKQMQPKVIRKESKSVGNPGKTSIYEGVSWYAKGRKWLAQMSFRGKNHFIGYYISEKDAGLAVNKLCDYFGLVRKNVALGDPPARLKINTVGLNKVSKYGGVSWDTKRRKWHAHVFCGEKRRPGGVYATEIEAAHAVNFVCDQFGIQRENMSIGDLPIGFELSLKKCPTASEYVGVSWDKANQKWRAATIIDQKMYDGGLHEIEEEAGFAVNLLCDLLGVARKNPSLKQPIVNSEHTPEKVIGNPECKKKEPNQGSDHKLTKMREDIVHIYQRLDKQTLTEYYCAKFSLDGFGRNNVKTLRSKNFSFLKSKLHSQFNFRPENMILCPKKYDKNSKRSLKPSKKIERLSQSDNEMEELENMSQYNGVYWVDQKKKWKAQIPLKGLQTDGALYEKEIDAALAVNRLCQRFGISLMNSSLQLPPPLETVPEPHKKQILPPAKHVGICIRSHDNKYMAQMRIDGRNCNVSSGRDYGKVLQDLNDMCEKQRKLGKWVNPKLGKWKPMYDPERLLQPSEHKGIYLNRTANRYEARIMIDGRNCFVAAGRDYGKVLQALNDTCEKQQKLGKRINLIYGESQAEYDPDIVTPLSPTRHMGITISGRTYLAEIPFLDGWSTWKARDTNYERILKRLRDEVAYQKSIGRKVSPYLGQLYPEYRSASTRIDLTRSSQPNGCLYLGVRQVVDKRRGTISWRASGTVDGEAIHLGQAATEEACAQKTRKKVAELRKAGKNVIKDYGSLMGNEELRSGKINLCMLERHKSNNKHESPVEFEVQAILDDRIVNGGGKEYKVLWKQCQTMTWEPEKVLKHLDVYKQFLKRKYYLAKLSKLEARFNKKDKQKKSEREVICLVSDDEEEIDKKPSTNHAHTKHSIATTEVQSEQAKQVAEKAKQKPRAQFHDQKIFPQEKKPLMAEDDELAEKDRAPLFVKKENQQKVNVAPVLSFMVKELQYAEETNEEFMDTHFPYGNVPLKQIQKIVTKAMELASCNDQPLNDLQERLKRMKESVMELSNQIQTAVGRGVKREGLTLPKKPAMPITDIQITEESVHNTLQIFEGYLATTEAVKILKMCRSQRKELMIDFTGVFSHIKVRSKRTQSISMARQRIAVIVQEVLKAAPREFKTGVCIKESSVDGLGMFATRYLPVGAVIGLFTGKLMTKDEAVYYHGPGTFDRDRAFYICALQLPAGNQVLVIDPHEMSSRVNHAGVIGDCTPVKSENLAWVPIIFNGFPYIAEVIIRPIQKGEEILTNYGAAYRKNPFLDVQPSALIKKAKTIYFKSRYFDLS